MENKNIQETKNTAQKQTGEPAKRKYSKTWEAALRLKGSLIVNDPKFLL